MPTKVVTAVAKGTSHEVSAQLIREAQTKFGDAVPALMVVMASTVQPLDELLPPISQAFPETILLGCSTAGEFTEAGPVDGATSLFAVAGDFRVFAKMAIGLRENAEAAVSEVINALPTEQAGFSHRTGLLLIDSFAGSGEEVTMLASVLLGEGVPLAGGAAGDDLKLSSFSYVGLGNQVSNNAVVAAMIFSNTPLGLGVCHGHQVLSQPLRITKAEGPVVFEIEGRPAFSVWDEYTRDSLLRKGLDLATTGPHGVGGFFGIFEAGLSAGTEYKIRAPLALLENGAMAFACGIPEGTVIRIMESDQARQIASARQAAHQARTQLGGRVPAGALVFDCACRKILLREQFGLAVEAIRHELGDAPLAGLEGYGEIALCAGDLSGFHNTTTVLLVFPESAAQAS